MMEFITDFCELESKMLEINSWIEVAKESGNDFLLAVAEARLEDLRRGIAN